MGAIPGSESDYFYATYNRIGDTARGCKSMLINGTIMPVRHISAALEIGSKRCMRGEDIMFLAEAVATRQAIAPVSNGQPQADTLAMTPVIKKSRLIDIHVCTAQQWNTWAELSNVAYAGFTGVNLGPRTMTRDNLLASLKSSIGFSAGVGTRANLSEDDFATLRMAVVQTLFDNIAKKQCCVIPLVGATYEIDIEGGPSNSLGYFSGIEINKYDYKITQGPFYARVVTVRHTFPPAAAGSKVMLFAYSGGHSWKAENYPSDQEKGEDAFCLVPTDGVWHEISSDGTLTVVIDGQTIFENVENVCCFSDPEPTVPEDNDPESTRSRQASWSYFLSSSNNNAQNAATFFALLDLDHTNLGHTIFY